MIQVGQKLYGFCGGYFGRDSHEDKRVEAVGIDWVIVRNTNGEVNFATDKDIHNLLEEYTNKEE